MFARARLCPALVLVIALSLASGCINVSGSDWDNLSRGTESITAPMTTTGPLAVTTANGSVELRASDVTEIAITATIAAENDERLKQTHVVARPRDGGGTEILVEWPDGKRRNNEGCSLVIQTPRPADSSATVGVKVQTSNGRVLTAGYSGPLNIVTSNGSVTINDHTGAVEARTSNGRIEAERVRGAVRFDTSNGRIEARDVSGPVRAHTSNGAIVVRHAADGVGPFDLATSNGSVRVTVGPSFSGLIDAKTSNGGLKAIGAQVIDSSRSHLKAQYGTAGVEASGGAGGTETASTIRSSNGSIEISRGE